MKIELNVAEIVIVIICLALIIFSIVGAKKAPNHNQMDRYDFEERKDTTNNNLIS